MAQSDSSEDSVSRLVFEPRVPRRAMPEAFFRTSAGLRMRRGARWCRGAARAEVSFASSGSERDASGGRLPPCNS